MKAAAPGDSGMEVPPMSWPKSTWTCSDVTSCSGVWPISVLARMDAPACSSARTQVTCPAWHA